MISLLPEWAPNLHPLVVHFPIAWLLAAIVVDVIALVLPRAGWAEATAACLYPAGALSAAVTYLSGRQAAATVWLPGMAHAIVQQHWNWALATTLSFGALAIVRLALAFRPSRPSRRMKLALVVAGLAGALVLVRTAEHGARLVYEQGVGTRSDHSNR
jgi:uncharacterized membrane protein